MKKLDKKDIDIMWELFNNSRQPISKIARSVKFPKETVKYRISQLEKHGVINKYYAIANASKINLAFYDVYVKLQGIPPKYEQECIQKLKDHPLTAWLISTSGRFSVHTTFLVASADQFVSCFHFFRDLFSKYSTA